jgi:dynein heavy chain
MIELSPVQSIIIDPQYQANVWLKSNAKIEEKAGPTLEVLSFHNPKFLNLLSASIKYGNRVLIENVGEDIDRALFPLFNKSMLKNDGETESIFLQGVMVPIDRAFKLYITTELKGPRFAPEVSVFSNFINFAVTVEGLEA